jgi:tRNA modification GTPase
MYPEDTIVAPATAPGQGAVAIVRLSGPRAIEIARTLWHPARDGEILPRRLYLGEIRDPRTGAAIDRALCVIMPAPNSLTGEHVAELHCHGGVYLTRRVVALAMALGARMADPGEFSRRAFLNGRMDLTEAEAVADLVSARGESALRQALAHLDGALAERVEGLRRQVVGIRAHLEAEIDFADEGIRLPSRNEIAQDIKRLLDDVALLHDSFERGRIMREGARTVIIGKPNAGKSSVLNLLLGSERAIVTPIPGTTRDVIEDSIQLGPYPLMLQDTAGVRESADEIERIGIARTRRHADEADLIIAIFDGSRPFEDEDRDVIRMCRDRVGVALLNKRDLPQVLSPEKLAALEMPLLAFSALKAQGVSELRDRLERAVESLLGKRGESGPEGVAISRERHREALARALEALESARQAALSSMPPEIVAVDVGLAAEALASITGAVTTEDILDAVFREFCIGK